jgi:hypothetical protein
MFLKIQLPCSHVIFCDAYNLMSNYSPGSHSLSCYCEECDHTQTVQFPKDILSLINRQMAEERHLEQLRNSVADLLLTIEDCVSRKIRLEIALSKTIVARSL